MNDIDDKILEALSAEDQEVMANYGKELGLFGLIVESFRGKLGLMRIAVIIVILALLVLLFHSAFNFFSVEEIAPKLDSLAIGLFALILVCVARLWYWMELNHLSTMREVKRLELQVSLLAKKLN